MEQEAELQPVRSSVGQERGSQAKAKGAGGEEGGGRSTSLAAPAHMEGPASPSGPELRLAGAELEKRKSVDLRAPGLKLPPCPPRSEP